MGEITAENRGYNAAFLILAIIGTVPALLYWNYMPDINMSPELELSTHSSQDVDIDSSAAGMVKSVPMI